MVGSWLSCIGTNFHKLVTPNSYKIEACVLFSVVSALFQAFCFSLLKKCWGVITLSSVIKTITSITITWCPLSSAAAELDEWESALSLSLPDAPFTFPKQRGRLGEGVGWISVKGNKARSSIYIDLDHFLTGVRAS